MWVPITCYCSDEVANWAALAEHVRLFHPDHEFDLAAVEVEIWDARADMGT